MWDVLQLGCLVTGLVVMRAVPPLSTVTQKALATHDTVEPALSSIALQFGCTAVGSVGSVDSNARESPGSTATHSEIDPHETDVIGLGAIVALNRSSNAARAAPAASTAAR